MSAFSFRSVSNGAQWIFLSPIFQVVRFHFLILTSSSPFSSLFLETQSSQSSIPTPYGIEVRKAIQASSVSPTAIQWRYFLPYRSSISSSVPLFSLLCATLLTRAPRFWELETGTGIREPPRRRPRPAAMARIRLQGVDGDLLKVLKANKDQAPARRRAREAFKDVQLGIDHILFKVCCMNWLFNCNNKLTSPLWLCKAWLWSMITLPSTLQRGHILSL